MFGKKLRKTCQYCETELPLLGDVCTYCGQKQTTSSWQQQLDAQLHDKQSFEVSVQQSSATPTQIVPTPLQNKIQPPSMRASTQKRSFKSPAQTQTQVTSSSVAIKVLRMISFGVWVWGFSLLIRDYMKSYYDLPFNEWTPVVCGAGAFFFFFFSFGSLFLSFISALALPFTAFFLLTKPGAAPITYQIAQINGQTKTYAFSYFSETHLYYVLPGFILGFLGAFAFLSFFFRLSRRVGQILTTKSTH